MGLGKFLQASIFLPTAQLEKRRADERTLAVLCVGFLPKFQLLLFFFVLLVAKQLDKDVRCVPLAADTCVCV